ncbi:MAG: tRNA (N(6)-L-threonylcarbamoyladenosine(37)-C(2))-methylthiotransferase MtaB [Clostridia bacterium]|nr:tRNA (N(6)-L-threonylcarbamoyladenosine(37)-C(2))-methylthiotransferase MtaB [Clostridia bacterium]
MKKAAFYTLGCKVNQYETEALTGIFEKGGYEITDFEQVADVYVINTCTVTNLSDRKSRQMIRRAKSMNQDAIVVVVGCYAQTAPEEVSSIPGVNLVIGTKERSKILDYIKEIENGRDKINVVGNIMSAMDFEELNIDSYQERTRAFLKIQEGCSQFCAYCIIPYARGPIRSRNPEDVVTEVKRLAEGGFKEIVLTGIHVASYGKDIKTTSLVDIIQRVHAIPGIERIRLGSIEPMTITEDFIKTAKSLEKLCPHYHLSLQSGCDETLKRMNRKYGTEEYRRVVKLLKDNIPDVSLTTDIMVGFPGETEGEFEKTYRFVEEMGFSKMHVFKYSPRKGTPAASFKDQVSPDIKEKRSTRLIELSDRMAKEFNEKYTGRTMPVLIEQEVRQKEGFIEGLTSNYIRVLCEGDEHCKGEIKDVELLKIEEDYMIGKITG